MRNALGAIAPDKQADPVLIDGQPLRDITAPRAWCHARWPVGRSALTRRVAVKPPAICRPTWPPNAAARGLAKTSRVPPPRDTLTCSAGLLDDVLLDANVRSGWVQRLAHRTT